jgi:hypothetical protein
MKLLPALGLGVAAVYVLSKLSFAGNASRLNYTISGISLGMSGLNPVISLNLVIQNPTNQIFNVAAIVANVSLNGEAIGNVAGFTPVSIPAASQANVPLTVTVSGLSLISDVVGILNGSSGVSALLHVTGTVNANSTLLPIDVQYQAV